MKLEKQVFDEVTQARKYAPRHSGGRFLRYQMFLDLQGLLSNVVSNHLWATLWAEAKKL